MGWVRAERNLGLHHLPRPGPPACLQEPMCSHPRPRAPYPSHQVPETHSSLRLLGRSGCSWNQPSSCWAAHSLWMLTTTWGQGRDRAGPHWSHASLSCQLLCFRRVPEHQGELGTGSCWCRGVPGLPRALSGRLEGRVAGRTGAEGGRYSLEGQGAHLAQEVIAADKVPVPGLHAQCLCGPVLQLKLECLVPAWVA